MSISEGLVNYLLGTVDGFGFEGLVQKLLAARYGDQFAPLGGVHDGGADGFFRSVLRDTKKSTSYVQMSIQADASGKIRRTARRLVEAGRTVRTLTYWTSRRLDVDQLEDSLSTELDIAVRVKDWHALTRLIDADAATQEAFKKFFRREIFELTSAGAATAAQSFDVVSDPSVYVFLQFERAERFGKGGLVSPIVDSLIYWALRETDPDSEKLLSRPGRCPAVC